MARVKKDFKKIVKEAENQGWQLKRIKSGYQLFAPDGVNIVTVHGTPSGHRALGNFLADMKRCGFEWKER